MKDDNSRSPKSITHAWYGVLDDVVTWISFSLRDNNRYRHWNIVNLPCKIASAYVLTISIRTPYTNALSMIVVVKWLTIESGWQRLVRRLTNNPGMMLGMASFIRRFVGAVCDLAGRVSRHGCLNWRDDSRWHGHRANVCRARLS